jgi:hypothetical protein
MTNFKKTLIAASLAFATTSLATVALTSYASAQCLECAMYPDRDPLNGGAQTPAAKMGLVQPHGAAAANNASPSASLSNSRAEMHVHHVRHARSPDARNR